MKERQNLLLPGVPRWPADQPVLVLEGVHKAFGAQTVLRDLHLSVPTGQTTVIAGQSGSGKSVLLRLMNGLTFADRGHVRLFGVDLASASERERTQLRKRCTMVFQNYALIDSMTVAQNVAFPLDQNTRMSKPEIERLVRELLEMLELPHAYHAMPSDLSGGMKKRVALARAVITNPEVVLFDEPTTGLDPIMIEFVDNLIIRTQAAYGITSVIISHDMASNRRLADQLAILADQRILCSGTFEDVQRSTLPEVLYFMGNATTERLQRGQASPPSGVSAPSEPAQTDTARVAPDGKTPPVTVSPITGSGEHARPSSPATQTPAATPPPAAAGEVVAWVKDLHKSFGNNHVLKGIDLSIPKGKITVIIGGSGSGKSVLVKHIIGLMKPSSGEIEVLGQRWQDLDARAASALRAQIGMLFQGAALFDSMTIRENLAFPLVEGLRQSRKQAMPQVHDIAEQTSVHTLLDRYPAQISNGERKRVALARALITKPQIMVYDEPTTGQDPVMMQRVDDMIVEANERFNITSIVISHDMLSTFRIADQIAMIHKGQLRIAGPPEALRASQDERVQAFIFAGAAP